MSELSVLFNGYSSELVNNKMTANCSCTLIKGVHNIIVDTMTSWDSQKLLAALKLNGLTPEEINYVISTHGHSDHIGNNNLFLKAKHIVGFSISFEDTYYMHPFDKGEEYIINNSVKIIPTPGHTLTDVTVVVTTKELEIVAIAGDLFEKFEDIQNPSIWLDAGSEDPVLQRVHRSKVADLANWIVPGHGPQFRVTYEETEALKSQIGKHLK